MQKKLYKKTSDKMLCGVCSGLGEYLNIDATLVRVIFTVATVFTTCFPGILVYIILAVCMPDEGKVRAQYEQQYGAPQDWQAQQQPQWQNPQTPPPYEQPDWQSAQQTNPQQPGAPQNGEQAQEEPFSDA